MRGLRLLALASLLLGTGAASPQPVVVSVGDGTVSATRLVPYDNAFAVTYHVTDGEEIHTGIWADQLRLRDVGARKAWVRVQSMAIFNGQVLTSVNMFDAVTLAPIGTILKRRDGTREYWTFADGNAEGHIYAPDGHETVKNVALAAPAYDFNCCMASLIPAALPLALGKSFTLPAVATSDGDPTSFVFTVTGRQRVKAGYLGMVDAWVVESHQPSGGTVTFWITDKPRRLVGERLTNFPTQTCTAPPTLEAATCPAQGKTAGLRFDQSFDLIGG